MTMPNDREITRAQRLGRLAARAGRALASACPYDANGDGRQRVLATRFVRAYVAAGGTVDGLEFGDQADDDAPPPDDDGRLYGHLGLPH